jgi:hypothetical protein
MRFLTPVVNAFEAYRSAALALRWFEMAFDYSEFGKTFQLVMVENFL